MQMVTNGSFELPIAAEALIGGARNDDTKRQRLGARW
jgi:hypothetical protein